MRHPVGGLLLIVVAASLGACSGKQDKQEATDAGDAGPTPTPTPCGGTTCAPGVYCVWRVGGQPRPMPKCHAVDKLIPMDASAGDAGDAGDGDASDAGALDAGVKCEPPETPCTLPGGGPGCIFLDPSNPNGDRSCLNELPKGVGGSCFLLGESPWAYECASP